MLIFLFIIYEDKSRHIISIVCIFFLESVLPPLVQEYAEKNTDVDGMAAMPAHKLIPIHRAYSVLAYHSPTIKYSAPTCFV